MARLTQPLHHALQPQSATHHERTQPMSEPTLIRPEWLDLVSEEIIEPERRIVDPHHHLWSKNGPLPYLSLIHI